MNNSDNYVFPLEDDAYDEADDLFSLEFTTKALEAQLNKKTYDKPKDFEIDYENPFLHIYSVRIHNPEITKRVRRHIVEMNENADYVTEVIKLPASSVPTPDKSCKNITYKDADCVVYFDKNTVVINDNNDEFLNVGLIYPKYYYYLKGSGGLFKLKILFAADDETYRMFKDFGDPKKQRQAMREYESLTDGQKKFFKEQFNLPVKDFSDGKDCYSPIVDPDALEVLYKTCEKTYDEKLRAKIDFLFTQYKSAGDHHARSNIIEQLSYILCISTVPKVSPKKSFGEILHIIDKHICGMDDFKDSFAEFLLAAQYSKKPNFAALLVGPPGTGKTSVGEVIAECCSKPFLHVDCEGANKISMGGLVRSYSGAKAGKVANSLWEIGTSDAVVLLDEIDKLAIKDTDGDPYSVILKALGPQKQLYDEFVDADIDVSATIFIATANDINKIPAYVLNRFGNNIFFLKAYSVEEKVTIAKNFSAKKILDEYNLTAKNIDFTKEGLELIAREYCKDEGMREMEDFIRSIVRKAFRIWSIECRRRKLTVDEDFIRANLRKKAPPENKIGY